MTEKTVKIFIGTEPRMWRGEAVLRHTIEKYITGPHKVVSMDYTLGDKTWEGWEIGRKAAEPAQRGRDEKGNAVWFTDFTNFRWAIPELCGFKGRAIYNDVDQIYLKNPRELMDLEMGGAAVLSVTTNETSVLLFDCEKFKDIEGWPTLEEMKGLGWSIQHYIAFLRDAGAFGQLPTLWNCLDGNFYQDGYTGLIHYTDMGSQPWYPYPERLQYRRHKNPQMELLWWDFYKKARVPMEAASIVADLPPGVPDIFLTHFIPMMKEYDAQASAPQAPAVGG